MQKGRKEKVNNISDILEEIVRCVTAPSFCVMPWKCVTMAVGDRTDPLVKKSVVHIYRNCVDGQNIFQIKVHNCKKEVCDHTICTKDCDTTQQTNIQSVKEAGQTEMNKKKRKKRNKYFDINKETTLGCCTVNSAHIEENFRSLKDSKRYASTNKNKRGIKKSESTEKPSCTLQIFADGKSRKLNFQLHPAMKVFLGKALDRIEGHNAKGRRTSSISSAMRERYIELLGKSSDASKSRMPKTLKQFSPASPCCNKNKRTESVEEFEINLPDNTSHTKDIDDLCNADSLAELLKSCNCDGINVPDNKGGNEICPELKINDGYLLHNVIPEQQFWSSKGKFDEETRAIRADFPLGRTPENFQHQQLATDNTYRTTNVGPISEPYHGGLNYIHSEQRFVREEERFHSPELRHAIFQNHPNNCSPNCNKSEAKCSFKQTSSDTSRNITCCNENNSQSFPNSSQCFQNKTRDKIIRAPYIVDYRSDNNELLVDDTRNINNRNNTILDKRAPVHSTEYINIPSSYRNNGRIYSPSIAHETFSFSPEYGQVISNNSDYCNRFCGVQHYDNFPEHGTDFINMSAASRQHYTSSYNQNDMKLHKQHEDYKTPICQENHENPKESRIFNHYSLKNDRDHRGYTEPDKRMFFMETNNEPRMQLEEVPTNDRSHNIINDQLRNLNYYKGSISSNDAKGKHTFNYPTYVRDEGCELSPENIPSHGSNIQLLRKDCNESDKASSKRERRKLVNSIATQYYDMPSNNTVISSNTPSNKQDKAKIIDNEKFSNDSFERNRRFNRGGKKNRKEKCNAEEKKVLQNAEPTTHRTCKLINKPRIQYESEEELFFGRLESIKTFKHIKPNKISSEERINNKIKIKNQKLKNLNRNTSKKNALRRMGTSKESDTVLIRAELTDETDSSVDLAEDFNVNNADQKSSDTSSSCYNFPEDSNNFHFFKPYENLRTKNPLSREITNETNERFYDDEYNSNSQFFCYPSQISWEHYENIHQIIPTINQKHYIQHEDTTNKMAIEPRRNIAKEGDSSNLCDACSKALNEEKSEVKSFGDCYANKYETRHSASKHLLTNNLQYKDLENLGESHSTKNDLAADKDELSFIPSNFNFDDVPNPQNCTPTNGTRDTNRGCNNKNDMKINIVHSDDLKELKPTIKCDNLKKKPSKMLHPQSVKKFFNSAKDYLNIRKYSTSSIRSGLSNGVLQDGVINRINHSDAVMNKVEGHRCVESRNLKDASDNKRNNDCRCVNTTQCNNQEARGCSENSAELLKSGEIEGSMSTTLKQSEEFRNFNASGHNCSETGTFKPSTNRESQVSLKDEKYRLYGSNVITIDYIPTEENNKKIVNNEFKILETESECEGFSDDMYCYSSSEWQSEVAKNWVGRSRKINNKPDIKVKADMKRNKSKSFYSLRSRFSNCHIEKEKKCNYHNEPMINATIALSPDKKKKKENSIEVEDQFQVNHYSKQKKEQKFSYLFSSSIKNNYKKIKGFVKRNQENKKVHRKISPAIIPTLKSPSQTETQSQSYLTPVTSTYQSGDSIVVESEPHLHMVDNSTVSETLGNESTNNTYTSESYFAKSDPIIRKIEPGTWQKVFLRKVFPQSTEISEVENMETENLSLSDISIAESGFQVRSNHRLIQPFGQNRGHKNNRKTSEKHSPGNVPRSKRRGEISLQSDHTVPTESIGEYNHSDGSEQNEASSCFENPIVDPKTGFRPLIPT